jgi:hypothetical protein
MFFFARRPLAALALLLVLLGGIFVYSQTGSGKAAMGSALDNAKVGTCVKGETQSDTRVVPCSDPAATAKIVKIFPKIATNDVMAQTACGGVDEADGAFYSIDGEAHQGADTTAYCIVSI